MGVGKNYQNILKKLIILQNNCQIAITYKLGKDYIYLTFDNSKLKQNEYKIKQNRVLAIDMNPNYLGYSVVDWENETDYKIISCGVFDIKSLNDKEANLKGVVSNSSERLYFKNKRNHEIIQIAYDLSKICKHFKCEICSIEDLNIRPNDTQKGKSLNKLVNNQWNRNKFENVLSKIINCSSTRLVKIHPEYSSILGNLIYRKEQLPDMVLSSIEIGRRGYEFYNQYLINRKEQKKNIIYPTFELVKEKICQSLEELSISSQFESYHELFSVLKRSKKKYRFLLGDLDSSRVFSKFYKKSYVKRYIFI